MVTYADLIGRTAQALADAVEMPRREARLLVALAARLEAVELIGCELDEIEDQALIGRVEAYAKRRARGEPFAHIAGRTEFYGLEFICDKRALVPRADSEVVVEAALALMPDEGPVRVADFGTGSGCLLVALGHSCERVRGVGVEADAGASSLAEENVAKHGLGGRLEIVQTRWQDWRGWGEVDLVVSNPPYIASDVIKTLAPDVQAYDPLMALDGGADGLAAYRSIIGLAAMNMRPRCPLVLEIGFDQDAAVRGLLVAAGFDEIGRARDLGGHDRVVFGRCPQN